MIKSETIKILIADDHPIIKTALKTIINSEANMEVIAEVTNGLEAVDQFKRIHPDVVLLDLSMPKMDGLEATKTILAEDPYARIIILTNSDSDENVFRAMEIGARGYVLKDSPHEHLISVIRRVHSGDKYIPEKLAERLSKRRYQPSLSDRELDVLQWVMRGRNNKAIGHELGIAESTVKSHIKSILLKLNVSDRTQAVTEALRRGILVSE